jgi:hypothetical protein
MWNSFHGHLEDDMKRILMEIKMDQAVISGGLRSVLQPLDM